MLRRSGTIFLALALLLSGALPMVWAARLQQGRQRRIAVCVGLIPTLGEPTAATARPDPDAVDPARSPNPNPYLWYVADKRTDMKPDGWAFYNPAAPATVTLEQQVRWGNNPLVQQGKPLRPDMGA